LNDVGKSCEKKKDNGTIQSETKKTQYINGYLPPAVQVRIPPAIIKPAATILITLNKMV
jgi:hypothetical protein